MITILGAGISGLSASYHLGHKNCIIFERNDYAGGHIHSKEKFSFMWDEGIHVSFTKNRYVQELFASSVENKYLSQPVSTTNYFKGNWVPHPAQTNLYSVPNPLRNDVLRSFLSSRSTEKQNPMNYEEWLIHAFGDIFYKNFPLPYTIKYWSKHPKELSTDWVGDRVFYPKIDEVKHGSVKPLPIQTHYITQIRYPKNGGYFSFVKKMYDNANIQYKKKVSKISLKSKKIDFSDGTSHYYDKLITTIPLPSFIALSDAPKHIKVNAEKLECSSLLLVNIITNHPAIRNEKWIYVYDEDKYTTRLYYTEGLSPENGQPGKSGIQVEVYFSKSKPKTESDDTIAKKVVEELIEMKLIKAQDAIENFHTRWVQHANVIFDHKRREAQNTIFEWLENFGLTREEDDLEPMTDWDLKEKEAVKFGDIILAGRFGQWKYYWTDDCVLRGKYLSE